MHECLRAAQASTRLVARGRVGIIGPCFWHERARRGADQFLNGIPGWGAQTFVRRIIGRPGFVPRTTFVQGLRVGGAKGRSQERPFSFWASPIEAARSSLTLRAS